MYLLSTTSRTAQLLLLLSTLLLLSASRPAAAFSEVRMPERVVAGRDVRVTVVADFADGDRGREGSVDARFTHFEVFLQGKLPVDAAKGHRELEGVAMPLCMLLNRTEVRGGVSELTLRVPASAMPAPARYALAIQQYTLDDGDGVMPDFSTSPAPGFELVLLDVDGGHNGEEGGGGRWADFESDPRLPYGMGDPLNVPCHAYDCVRRCFQDYYPDFLDQHWDLEALRPMMKCKALCPGVHTPDEVWDIINGKNKGAQHEHEPNGAEQEL